MKKKTLYPGCVLAEKEKSKKHYIDTEPDFIPGTVTPNYDKFPGWDTEKVLRWLNID